MKITIRDDVVPAVYRRRLIELAARWPVGTEVRHAAGWTGRVADDYPDNPFGLGLDVAHVVLGVRPSNTAVCVEAVINGRPATVFYRPEVLSPAGDAAPAPKQVWPRRRQRTTRRAA